MRTMIKGKLFYTEHIWFEEFSSKKEIGSQAARVCVHANPTKISKTSELQHTLISDLDDANAESLLLTFSSTVRNEIRRAEREGVICKAFTSDDLRIRSDIINIFADMYGEMYAEKGMDRALEINSVKAYIENNAFLLTSAYIVDMPCVFHSYIIDSSNARLLHSCSEFRVQDNAIKNTIGRANKFLHYKDMLYLKELGVVSYDWGGISNPKQPNGIDKFKMSFGGEPIDYYNCTINLSLKAKIASLYQRVFRK